MASTLQFLKDWIPTLAVLTGGLWILIKWIYEEKIRVRKEIASLDGKLTITATPLGKYKQLVTVEALWVNHCPFPIYLDIENCVTSIYAVSEKLLPLNQGITLKDDLGKPICTSYFLKRMVELNYFLEPNTESVIVTHFVLEPGIYGIRMVLHGLNKGELWWKEKIADITHGS